LKQATKSLLVMLVLVLSLGLITNCSTKKSPGNDDIGYGAAAAFKDTDLTLSKMLKYAIQDEYLAKSEYQYVLDTFGDVSPFKDIMMAEVQHIKDVKILLEKYKFPVPEDLSNAHLIKVEDSNQTFEIGVNAEQDNITMYQDFLTKDLPEDVSTTFEFLMKASEQHLLAFEKELTR
jgi:hypothetical protein